MFPNTRLRRLRNNSSIRALVQENEVTPNDLIQPLFIAENLSKRSEITSMPGQFQLSLNELIEECQVLDSAGIKAVLLFGIPAKKDPEGLCACADDGIVQKSIRLIKSNFPQLQVISDLCFCEYTTHGHCGIIKNEQLDNDRSLELLCQQALSHAKAGVDIIAPSGMLDGMVISLRQTLDEAGFTNVIIMSYSAKFASSFYGPFRDAAECSPQFGDRKTYQMNPANSKEALREAMQDVQEGADIIMVKPGLPYLDIIKDIKNNLNIPIAAYQVSGEYSMIKAAAANAWISEEQAVAESLLAFKRAGADLIITYFAREYADRYNRNSTDKK